MRLRAILPLIGLGLIMAAGSSLPYAWLAVKTPKDAVYQAPMITGAADSGAYYADMAEGRDERWLVRNQFTSEAQTPRLFQPLWWLLGRVVAITGWSIPLVFHLARVLSIGAMVWLLWKISGRFDWSRGERYLSLVLILTSSGLGWLSGMTETTNRLLGESFDLWVSESNTFLSLTHSALFILSEVLLAWLIISIGERWLRGDFRVRPWVGPLMLLLAIIHPYDLVTLATVGLVIAAWQWVTARRFPTKEVLTLAIWMIPAGIYYWWVLQEPALAGWFKQNIDLTGSPLNWLAGFGLLWPLAIYGSVRGIKTNSTTAKVLMLWTAVATVLVFFPGLTFARRLSSGVHIATAGLAAAGLIDLVRRIKPPTAAIMVAGMTIAILTLTNVVVVTSYIKNATTPITDQYPPAITKDLEQVLVTVNQVVPRDQAILAQPWTANIVAGLTGRTVVIGHGHQTVNILAKINDWARFMSGSTSDKDRNEIVERLGAGWLIWTENEVTESTYRPGADKQWETTRATPKATLYRRIN